jgi:MFS family permease
MANSQGIITMVFPQSQRGRALGIYGGAISIGTLAGPTLGGIIVTYMNWQYIFLLKVPIAVLAFILCIKFFPKDDHAEKEKMDYPGAFLYTVAIVPLLYTLQVGYTMGYASLIFLSGIALSILAFTAFFFTQRKKDMPLLDFSIFKNPVFSVSVVTVFAMTYTNAFRNIIIPFYMQGVLGTPPDVAGLYMSIAPIIILLITPISGYLTDRVGGERLAIVGQIINLVGLLLMSTLDADSSVITMVMYFCAISFGGALFQAPNNTLIMSNLPKNKLGIGGSVSMCIRNIAMSVGIASTTAILYGSMGNFLGYPVAGYTRGSGQDDAFIYGMRNAYYAAAAMCLVGIIASFVRIKSIVKGKESANK